MSSTAKKTINVRIATQKVEVDNRVPLRYYYRIADNLLKQATLFREEKNIIDLYIVLLRFSSLITETIPLHQDYKDLGKKEKSIYKKKLLLAIEELESLNPAVRQKVNEVRTAQLSAGQCQQNAQADTTFSSEASSSNRPSKSRGNSSSLNNEQVAHRMWLLNNTDHLITPSAPPASDDIDISRTMDASILSALSEKLPTLDTESDSLANACTNRSSNISIDSANDQCAPEEPTAGESIDEHRSKRDVSTSNTVQHISDQGTIPSALQMPSDPTSLPSAPPIEYLVIDDAPKESPSTDTIPAAKSDKKQDPGASTSCTICLDSPVEGACVPCGHMAGCMPCLNEVKAKNWGCPVCRAKIEFILRVYAV